ncbi:SLC13 family permease [Natronosalvus caseinilyticus]|uniref:SLC13 family permease n=1 Tax=Natronosalvus caseinilyticus TaxID=2953747 RepID=UPI0028A60540|nr:SLC13 family permease [Natronosalvus caseinilyticus]
MSSPTIEMLIVFCIIAVALALFITQPIPLDVTALLLIVVLVLLEPWTTISPEEGIAGFANPATITVLMMFILSEGVRRTGAVQLLGERLAAFAGDSERRQLGSIIGVSGFSAGFINNTPVVAIMIPVVNDLARRTNTSPSRLLIPLSFASMLGGMLTLIGTSTNLLASSIVARPEYLGRPFSMFEFTALGALVLVSGSLYLLVATPYLLPERLTPRRELTDEFEIAPYLTEVVVPDRSPVIGQTVQQALADVDVEVEAVTLLRNGDTFGTAIEEKVLQPEDVLLVRTDREAILDVVDLEGFDHVSQSVVHDANLEIDAKAVSGVDAVSHGADATDEGRATPQVLAEVVIAPDGALVRETLASVRFREQYEATVLAIRRGPEIVHTRMDRRPLRGGDILLVQASREALDRLGVDRDVIVAQEFTQPAFRRAKLPLAIAIIAGVVGLAALKVVPILITSIAGVIAMVATGVLEPEELYDAIDWSVIFLLAGVLPLGVAMEETGAAAFLAAHAIGLAGGLHIVVVLGLFYLFTALLTEMLSNNASVILMIPVAFDAAVRLGGDPYAFVLAVMFAASTPLLSPVGYQTNLMVYGPGGYKFTDFARLGAPLQLLLTIVTTLGIVAIWGV